MIDGATGELGATFEGAGKVRDADFKTLSPAVLKLGDRERSLTLLADVGGGRAEVEASQTGEALRANATLTGVGLGLLDQDIGHPLEHLGIERMA